MLFKKYVYIILTFCSQKTFMHWLGKYILNLLIYVKEPEKTIANCYWFPLTQKALIILALHNLTEIKPTFV